MSIFSTTVRTANLDVIEREPIVSALLSAEHGAFVCARCMQIGISRECLRRTCLWNHDPGDEDRR